MGASEVIKSLMSQEVYIYVVLAIGSFLVLFGSSRRRYNSVVLRFLIMVIFNLSFILITYIISQMVRAGGRGLFFLIWAAYLVLFHGISDAISAQALEDNEQWNLANLKMWLTILWVLAVYSRSSSVLEYSTLTQMIMGGLACGPSIYKAVERVAALKKGSKKGVALDTNTVAEFMAAGNHHHYHDYVVIAKGKASSIDISSENVITVGKVLNCQGRFLNSKMKDLCLSFSMYNLLCCHFAGYSFPLSVRDGQLEFVRSVLLQGDAGAGENYPFWLIEQELGYLYDRFYTKYAHLFEKEAQVERFVFFACCAAVSVVIQLFYLMPLEKDESMHNNDILETRIIIGFFVCLEFLQILFLAVSNWVKLLCLCKYVRKPSKLYALLVKVVCSFPSYSQLWGRQLGQYCFLESFHKSPGLIYKYPFSLFLENPGKGRAGTTFIPLSPQVQRAVLAWIKQNGRRLMKGRASLIDNGVGNEELLSACEFEKTTKVIMVWHIATSLCEFQHRKTCQPLETFGVSTALSKYCAYLVAFAPRLLPDHYVRTDYFFDSAVICAQQLLQGCKSMEDRCIKIMDFAETEESLLMTNVTGAGGRVAKLLVEEVGDDEDRLWKILANFWTEMVLFVAPADDPRPHAEHLAQGGEFVTHLMVLLFHAGVPKRDFIEDAATV